jgi:hypothetical protein
MDNPATNPLAIALAAAHKELRNPAKDRTNPYFGSKYATLDALQDASRSILAKHGLSVSQVCQPAGTLVIDSEKVITEATDKEGTVIKGEGLKIHPFLWELKTILMHESGVSIESVFPLVAVTKGPQQFGSELTYMRRYAYAAILNMTADEDDDGNEAQNSGNTPIVPESEVKKMVPKKTKKSDDILERTPSPDPGPEVDPWRVRRPTGPVPTVRPTTETGPVDTEANRPDEIPGLESAAKIAEEVLGAKKLEEMTLLEQVQAHLDMDGFKEEDLMTLLRQFKLTRAQQIINVENKTLSTVVDKWETISKRLKDSKKEEIL